MPGKRRVIHGIDMPRPGAFDAGADLSGSSSVIILPPAPPAIGAPYSLSLSTAIERNAVTPTAQIGATWLPPPGTNPAAYVVQWSTNSGFTQPGTGGAETQGTSATISGLIPNTLYYVRVAGIVSGVQGEWSATASITTAADTTAPSPVTSPAGTFAGGGDLVVSWVNPTSANFRDVEVVIKASSGGATLATLFKGTSPLVWTVAENLAATSGAGDPTLYVELRARSWGGIFSTSVNTGTITKSAPSAPSVTLTGAFSLLVAQVTSAPESSFSVFEYVWKRDGATQRTLESPQREQTYELGASGDEGSHSWTVTVRQKDAFGQYSSGTTSSAVVLDTITIAYLRAGLIYTDSVGNSTASLAVLKDDVKDAGGVSYAA